MTQEIFGTLIKLEKELNMPYNDAIHLFNEFTIKYKVKHNTKFNKRSDYVNRDKTWERYASRIYLEPVRNFHKFLDKTNLEEQVIGHAAKGDSNWTAHWLRTIKDVTKMYRSAPRESYLRIQDDYFTIKKSAEELLGERLQL
jgi:hypothetical protein